jgi:tetratricopeptide (TPR) repeat protein
MGVVHRDVKPANLLLDDGGHLWVTDFGLAKLDTAAGMTMSGDLLGTLRYMSPEQALARHGLVDHRTDVYSLGATLYELLTLRPAVDGADKQETLRQIAFEEPVALRKLDRTIPVELETITLKALVKNPVERYATAADLAADLRRWLKNKPIKAKPPTLWQRAASRLRRHPRVVAAALAVAVLAAIGAFASLYFIDRQKQRAEDAVGDARAAYARARLALDEMSSQVIDDWLAKQPALTHEQKQFLERALGHYEWLADRVGADAEARAGVAAAHMRGGDIRQKLGQTVEAEASYSRAVELYQRLADEFPGQPNYRLALAKGHRARGAVLHRTGRTAEAELAYKQAVALHEGLVNHSSGNAEYRYEFAGTLLDYGGLLGYADRDVQAERALEAEKAFHQGLELMEALVGETAAPPAYRQRLGQLHIRRALVLNFSLRRHADAEQSARRGVQVLENLEKSAGSSSDAARYREDLADGFTKLGYALGELRRPLEAVDADRRAVELRDRFVSDFPAVPEYRHRLTRSVESMGDHLSQLGQFTAAEAALRRAITILEQLAADFATVPEYRDSLADTIDRLAINYARAGRFADAEDARRQYLAERERLAADFPAVRRYQFDMVSAQVALAHILGFEGKHVEAEAAFRRSIELRPDDARLYGYLGIALSKQGRYGDAEAAFDRYIDLKPDFSRGLNDLAWLLATHPDPASRNATRAVELAKAAVANAPSTGSFHSTLGVAYYRAGHWKEAVAELEKSNELDKGGPSYNWFFLAMSHSQLGNRDEARKYIAQAVEWMETNHRQNDELRRFRAEAEELLGTKTESKGAPSGPPRE